jgi:ribosome-associated toxin RatA of RatAB toxin-antitoxin module
MTMRAFCAVAVAFQYAGAAPAADDLTVEAYRRGPAVEVVARATLRASHELVWRTLTDYDRLATFIPGLLKSRVIERRGPAAIVEQFGEVRFLIFSFPIEVTLASVEKPPDEIEVHALKGTLKQLEGGYRIERGRDPGALVLHWRGLIQPAVTLPPLLGEVVMRANIEDQFAGMVREIERREAERAVEAGR